jgi:hypothetical protein
MAKWLRNSVLVVYEAKIEMCHFHKHETLSIEIKIGNSSVKYKNTKYSRTRI